MAAKTCPDCLGWESKCQASEKELKYVKNLANKAIIEHEDLVAKYRENTKQYEELCEIVEEKDKDIEKLKNIIQPFVDDFRKLELKAEFEATLRQDAENYARKAHKQYMDIKRKSLNLCHQFNISTAGIDIDIDEKPEGAESDTEEEDVKRLREQISDLEEKVFELASQVDKAEQERDDAIYNARTIEEELDALKREKQAACENLQRFEEMTSSFKRVSVLALEEITEWKNKYDQEKAIKDEALTIAHGLQRDKRAIQHQSQAVIASAFSQDKLRNALLTIEDKSRENEQMKQDYDKKIEELEAQVSQSGTVEKLAHLERCIEVNEIEMDGLKNEIGEQKKKIEALDFDKRCLKERLDIAEKKNMGAPPPPPPPPPPVKAPMPFALFRSKKKGAAGSAAPAKPKNAVKGNDNYDKALEELMRRIKERGQRQEKPDMDALVKRDKRKSRVDEINNVLTSLSSRPRPQPRRVDTIREEEPNEFQKKMQERRKISNVGIEGDTDASKQ